ncbi:hypothetical protein JCM6882_006411 [Rhodosporidiobolus microsporus]
MFARPALSSLRHAVARPSPCACRAFSSFPPVASPAPSSSAAPSTHRQRRTEADQQATPASNVDQLLDIVTGLGPAPSPEADNPASILRHLNAQQVISPQNLTPEALLAPFAPRPDFSRAFPLGPPTEYGETHDPFVRYGIDPLDPSKGAMNSFIGSQFVTSMGKIQSRGKTMLQRKSQRKIGKLVRRARSMGIMPTFGVSMPSRR